MMSALSFQICLFGTIANIFNIIVLTRKEMCKAPINIILKWLAVTDMFVMIEYIPFSIYMYLIFPGKCKSMFFSRISIVIIIVPDQRPAILTRRLYRRIPLIIAYFIACLSH